MERQRSRKGQRKRERGHIPRLEQDARLADEDPWAPLHPSSTELRRAVAEACWKILGEPVQARGSSPFALGDAFDQARRDFPTRLGALCPPAPSPEARFRPFGCAPGGHLE